MKTQKLILPGILVLFYLNCYPQSFRISTPKLEFDGTQLKIGYGITDDNASDHFYVWVEMERKNGEKIMARALAGDVGEKIKAGMNRTISWIPAKDSVFLNEEILVEVLAERYVKQFNKGSMVLMSALLPGLGQSKIKGKPYWLTGVAAYGALAGGFIMKSAANKEYDSYLVDENPASRSKSFDKAQKELNTSSVLLVSGAAIWAANLIWVAAIPEQYQPLKNARFSFERAPLGNTTLIALRIDF